MLNRREWTSFFFLILVSETKDPFHFGVLICGSNFSRGQELVSSLKEKKPLVLEWSPIQGPPAR